MSILVIAEHDNVQLKGATHNVVAAATKIGGDIHVLVAGANARAVADHAAKLAGVSKVLLAESPALADALAENVAEQVLALAPGYSHILFAATASGKNVAPRVAARLDVAQISEIQAVDAADTFQRAIYAGNAVATVQSTDATKVITVRTTGFDAVAESGSAAVEAVASGQITHFVSAMGTTGTIMGVGRYLKLKNPDIKIVGAQPAEGSQIAGIRKWPEAYLPAIYDPSVVDQFELIEQKDAEAMARRLAAEEGICAGVSAAGALVAALRVAQQARNATIAFIVCDRGDRYLSTGLFDEQA
jgi:hypothetical protein